MSIEAALRTHIISKAQITAVIGPRCEFGRFAPEQQPLPHIMFTSSGRDHDHCLDAAPVDLTYGMFAFEVRATKKTDIPLLSDLLGRALQELESGATVAVPGTGDVTIDELTLLDDGTDDDPVIINRDGRTQAVWSRSLICEVGYRRDTSPVT